MKFKLRRIKNNSKNYIKIVIIFSVDDEVK